MADVPESLSPADEIEPGAPFASDQEASLAAAAESLLRPSSASVSLNASAYDEERSDVVSLQAGTDLFGQEFATAAVIDRDLLAAGLHANLKDLALEEFVSLFVTRVDAVVDYAELCVGQNVGQRISLLFNPHRLDTATKACATSLYASLKDDRFAKGLARVMLLKKGRGSRTEGLLYDATAGIGGLNGVSWIQEFPPHVARDLALEYNLTQSARVLDPCAGWGGRMIGFSAVVDFYTCCEPSTRTAAGLRRLHAWLRQFRGAFTATIHEAPFEDVDLPRGVFDFALTSPPYYDTECYAEESTNSLHRYATFEAWCRGFYAPLIHRTMQALKPGARFVINVGSRVYPLNEQLFQVAERHYRVERQKGRLSASNGLGKEGEGEAFYEISFIDDSPSVLVDVAEAARRLIVPRVDKRVKRAQPQKTAPVVVVGASAFAFLGAEPEVTVAPEPEVPAHLEVLLTSPAPRQASVTVGQSLADFLGTAPRRMEDDWRPDEIPNTIPVDDLVLNFETDGLDWHGGNRPVSVALCSLDGQFKKFLPWGFAGGNLPREQVIDFLKRELRGKNILGANTKFDVHMGRTIGVDFEEQGNTVGDVQLWAALLDDNRKQVKLDVLVKDFLGEDGPPRVDESRMTSYHASEVAVRAIYQVEAPARLRDELYYPMEQEGLQRVRQVEDDCIYPVVEMEKNGALLDLERLDQMHDEAVRNRNELMLEVCDEAGFAFDVTPTGWQRLFEKCGLKASKSYAEDVVGVVEHPLVKKAHLANQYGSLDSKTFAAYKKVVGADGIMHFDINQLRNDEGGTRSGRFSIGYVQQCPNIDNHSTVFGDKLFPRRLFISASGMVLEGDCMQVEYRLFAHDANNAAVIKAYQEDPLTSFHKMMWGKIKSYKPDIPYSDVKRYNFARQYGAKSIKLAQMLGDITGDVADEIRKAKAWNDSRLARAKELESIYKKVMPEGDQLLDYYAHLAKPKCDDFCRQDDTCHRKGVQHQGYVETLLGRRSRFPHGHKSYIGLNRREQGSGADLMKLHLISLHKNRKRTGFLMRLTIHDSVVGDAQTPETATMVKELLNTQLIPLRVPILWSCSTGRTWGDAKG